MLGAVGHLASYARFLAGRGERERDDAEAMRALCATDLGLAPGLEIEWLGTAGYRPLPDPAMHDRYLRAPGPVAGVLVGHTHFDHAVDVPALAARAGCSAYGSRSLARLMALHGQGERAVEVVAHRPYELGPFTVTFVPSRHSKLLLGLKVPFDGELTCEHLDALSPAAYRCGQVWGIHIEVGGTTLYHQGSADLLDDEVRHRGVDVFLAEPEEIAAVSRHVGVATLPPPAPAP